MGFMLSFIRDNGLAIYGTAIDILHRMGHWHIITKGLQKQQFMFAPRTILQLKNYLIIQRAHQSVATMSLECAFVHINVCTPSFVGIGN